MDKMQNYYVCMNNEDDFFSSSINIWVQYTDDWKKEKCRKKEKLTEITSCNQHIDLITQIC